MNVQNELAAIVLECFRTPGRKSVWYAREGKYVCSHDPGFQQALAEQPSAPIPTIPAPLSGSFKWALAGSLGGAILFVGICVTMTITKGNELPDLYTEITKGFFDFAKVAFGTATGLLVAQFTKK